MKFNKNILIAGAVMLSMAACEPEMKQPSEAEIDAQVEAKVAEMKKNLQQECDNTIMAMATAKADSIMVVAANKPQVVQQVIAAPAPKPKKPVAKTPTKKAPVKTNPKADKMSGNAKGNVEAKKSKMSGGQDKKAEDNLKKKKSKMNRGGN